MKKLLTLFFLLLNVFALSAQDLIVTHSGDSINAKITRIKSGYIYFNYREGRKIHNTLLPPDSVTFYQYNFYNYATVPLSKVITREEISNWRIALNGGWSWRVAPADQSLNAFEKEYIDDLKSGHQFGGEANYFFNNHIGVGVVYNAHLSSASVSASAQFPNGSIKNGLLSDDIWINFIGPSFNVRFMSRKNTNIIYLSASLGYSDYTDKSGFVGDTIIHTKITGKTIGLNYDFGYDFGISKHLAIGAGLSLKIASLTSVEITENNMPPYTVNLDQNSYESLARIDIFLGIRFR